ncbi:MAG: prepilin-type N-terminal cleavage/methylation domain-containing protein, partial [Gammaproteobacteria bacterium]
MNKQSGLSLIELMVAISIGAVLMAGLVATFQNSSNSRRELEKSGLLIENGRYAIDILYEDLRHAGYYGHYYALDEAPATLPDPCETDDEDKLKDALPLPIQGYRATNLSTDPDITDTNTCEGALLTAANLKAGSDILIVRRAETGVFTGTPTANEIYMQSNSRDANIMFGNDNADVPADTADNDATTSLERSPSKTPSGTADTRKYHVHVYFVAP